MALLASLSQNHEDKFKTNDVPCSVLLRLSVYSSQPRAEQESQQRKLGFGDSQSCGCAGHWCWQVLNVQSTQFHWTFIVTACLCWGLWSSSSGIRVLVFNNSGLCSGWDNDLGILCPVLFTQWHQVTVQEPCWADFVVLGRTQPWCPQLCPTFFIFLMKKSLFLS